MLVEQLYTSCLAQGAYYIQSGNEAAIIDPLRDYKPYIELAKKNGAEIKFIFETHFHADFVSGHLDLAKNTGAEIIFGPNAATLFKCINAIDGEEFKLGKLTVKALHTPGHTLESTTFLLLDETKKPHSIFTGDTLFIGDVGRPDLAIASNLTQEDLAGMLYDSLRNKIMGLPDDVIVYPAHGAGSACGKNISRQTFDTLGNQKKTNYALGNISKSEFIQQLTTDILPAPQYFSKNAELNKTGYSNFDEVTEKGSRALTVKEVIKLSDNQNALILDVRSPDEFAAGHIAGSVFIGIDGQFAPWVGALIPDLTQAIVIVAPVGREAETVMRLSRVGYDNCSGYLDGGIDAWVTEGNNTEVINLVSAEEFCNKHIDPENILDVRKPGEFATGHINGVKSHPLDFINSWQTGLEKEKGYFVHCAGGYRSMIAASLLKKNGYQHVFNVLGGYEALTKTNLIMSTDIYDHK